MAAYKKNVRKSKRDFWKQLCNGAKDKFGLAFKLTYEKVFLPEHLVHTVLNTAGQKELRLDVVRKLITDRLGGVEHQPEQASNEQAIN